jgi:ketosteroid isomerase-like protein
VSCRRRQLIRVQSTENTLPAFVALLTISLIICRPSLSATSAELAAAAAAVRKTDAEWAAAASTASVDAWMAFYAADAIVLLPNDQLASGQELLRHSVSRLLAQSHLSVAWRPIKVEIAQSGDLAVLIAAFDLRFGDSRAVPVSDRGRRLEIWKKQGDRAWKCIVDTWTVDEPISPNSGAAAPPAQTAPTAPTAQTVPAVPAAVPQFGPPTPARGPPTKYGDVPTDYEASIRKYFLEHLKYPESVQYREITQPEQGYTTAITGTVLMSEKREYGWKVKATINAKKSDDSYVGFKTYTFLFRGEKIVDARIPLPGGEMN